MCVCLLLMWVELDLCSYLRSMLRFIAVHIVFYTSSIWLLSSVCVCLLLYCLLIFSSFCSSQGLAWMQKVMVPRSNGFFFILTRGLVWNRPTFVLLRFFNLHKIMLPTIFDGVLHGFVWVSHIYWMSFIENSLKSMFKFLIS